MSRSDALLYLDRRILDWTRERERLTELLDARDNADWPPSPERKAWLLKDIAEVNRIIARLDHERKAAEPPRSSHERSAR